MRTREVRLHSGEVTLIDEDDWPAVSGYSWLADRRRRTTYAYAHVRVSAGVWVNLKLHRLILAAPDGYEVDHINHDGLDNRRANLRICSPSQNRGNARIRSTNTTGFKGVSKPRNNPKFLASITVDGRSQYLGSFATAEEAARAYDASALQKWGVYAHLNFPTDRKAHP